jgi:hypothetical protein
MRLKRILIEDFKQFTGQLLIDDLNPGLNIFTGPNEAGKTSIAIALRTIFLEKHRSSTLKHLVSWQASSGQPRVEVEFTTGNQHYLLRKSFVIKSRCEMIRNGQQRLEGEEAEQALSSLLRFSLPNRGSAAPEHGGIPGLLWITQGQTQDVERPVTHAAAYLRDALNQLSGSNVDGGEDVLISAVNQELNKYLTEKTRKPTAVLASVEAELQTALEQEQHLREQQAQFEDDVDRLVKLQAEYDDVARRKPWETLEKRAAEAQGKVAELRSAASALEQLETLQKAGGEQIRLLREREQDANKELEALAAIEAEYLQAKKAAEDAADELQQLKQTMSNVASAVEEAQQKLQLALAAEQAKELRATARLQEEEAQRLAQSLRNVESLRVQIKTAASLVNATEVDETKLKKLRALEPALSNLQAKMEAAGTRIEYQLTPGSGLLLNGEHLQGSGYTLLEGKAILHIPDIGDISVVPGASNFAALSAEYNEKKSEQAAHLIALGVPTLADAEARLATHRSHKQELESLNKQLSIYAPDGIDALEQNAAAAKIRLQGTLARLQAMPDAATACTLQEARNLVSEAGARHSACEKRHRELYGNRSSLEAKASSLLDQIEKKRALLQSSHWLENQAKRKANLVDALAEESVGAQRIQAAKSRLEELSADANEKDVERFSASAHQQREAHGKQKIDLSTLAARLEQQGASGIGERLAEATALVERLQRRKAELALRADALALLSDLLVEERDRTVQRLQAPLLSRLAHYSKKLFPQAELSLDENLSLSTFKRNGWGAELKQLSYGTQEQLGILCRLAYADLLKEAKIPTLLMLDDAIVHTDSARRDRIKRALLDAGERHQFLVFTCHPEAWDDLGVISRSIESMRVKVN